MDYHVQFLNTKRGKSQFFPSTLGSIRSSLRTSFRKANPLIFRSNEFRFGVIEPIHAFTDYWPTTGSAGTRDLAKTAKWRVTVNHVGKVSLASNHWEQIFRKYNFETKCMYALLSSFQTKSLTLIVLRFVIKHRNNIAFRYNVEGVSIQIVCFDLGTER